MACCRQEAWEMPRIKKDVSRAARLEKLWNMHKVRIANRNILSEYTKFGKALDKILGAW